MSFLTKLQKKLKHLTYCLSKNRSNYGTPGMNCIVELKHFFSEIEPNDRQVDSR